MVCRAENPAVSGLFLESTWKISVVCEYSLSLARLHLQDLFKYLFLANLGYKLMMHLCLAAVSALELPSLLIEELCEIKQMLRRETS